MATAPQVRVALRAMPCSRRRQNSSGFRRRATIDLDNASTSPCSGEKGGRTGDLRYRTARVPGDHRAGRLRLHDDAPELLGPGRRGHARHEYDVGAAEKSSKSRRPARHGSISSCSLTPRAAASSRAGRSSGPEPIMKSLAGRTRPTVASTWTASRTPFSGTSRPKSASTTSSSSSDCSPGLKELRDRSRVESLRAALRSPCLERPTQPVGYTDRAQPRDAWARRS